MPNRSDFQLKLNELFISFEGQGLSFADISAGDLHRLVGGYPSPDHRMPVC
jgi:5-methylcytosine-specific restriction protein A